MSLRGVIFDLGGTLLDFGGWRSLEERGASGWRAYLLAQGYHLPDEAVIRAAVWEQMQAAWRSLAEGRVADMATLRLAHQLGVVAERIGVAVAPEHAAEAQRAFVEAVQPGVRPMPGAVETVHAVHERGLRLALISNTMWPGAYHEADLARFGMLEPFEALFFSADEGMWKPDAAIFRRAVEALNLSPNEALYVGDSLFMDVMGAQGAGLRSVWVENDDPYMSSQTPVTPDATVRQLTDLLPLIDAWRNHAQ